MNVESYSMPMLHALTDLAGYTALYERRMSEAPTLQAKLVLGAALLSPATVVALQDTNTPDELILSALNVYADSVVVNRAGYGAKGPRSPRFHLEFGGDGVKLIPPGASDAPAPSAPAAEDASPLPTAVAALLKPAPEAAAEAKRPGRKARAPKGKAKAPAEASVSATPAAAPAPPASKKVPKASRPEAAKKTPTEPRPAKDESPVVTAMAPEAASVVAERLATARELGLMVTDAAFESAGAFAVGVVHILRGCPSLWLSSSPAEAAAFVPRLARTLLPAELAFNHARAARLVDTMTQALCPLTSGCDLCVCVHPDGTLIVLIGMGDVTATLAYTVTGIVERGAKANGLTTGRVVMLECAQRQVHGASWYRSAHHGILRADAFGSVEVPANMMEYSAGGDTYAPSAAVKKLARSVNMEPKHFASVQQAIATSLADAIAGWANCVDDDGPAFEPEAPFAPFREPSYNPVGTTGTSALAWEGKTVTRAAASENVEWVPVQSVGGLRAAILGRRAPPPAPDPTPYNPFDEEPDEGAESDEGAGSDGGYADAELLQPSVQQP
jgi:hypothetical protein